MTTTKHIVLSVVLPVYNEAASLPALHNELTHVLSNNVKQPYEIIYCDDGSNDDTLNVLRQLASQDKAVKVLRLARNFGKEIATTAGLQQATGEAILTLDADGQHPLDLIPEFYARWRAGSKVVVGLRTANDSEGWVKRAGSRWFYRLINRFSRVKLTPGATDFRLIDRQVQQDFNNLTERNRITRGLVDWLGYPQEYIAFTANPRQHGTASYSLTKLIKLAVDSLVSMSLVPLHITAYLGAVLLPVSGLLGIGMIIDKLAGDPLSLHATGSAYLIVLILFLLSIIMMSQGIIGLYVAHIHSETQNRPLYVIDREASIRLV